PDLRQSAGAQWLVGDPALGPGWHERGRALRSPHDRQRTRIRTRGRGRLDRTRQAGPPPARPPGSPADHRGVRRDRHRVRQRRPVRAIGTIRPFGNPCEVGGRQEHLLSASVGPPVPTPGRAADRLPERHVTFHRAAPSHYQDVTMKRSLFRILIAIASGVLFGALVYAVLVAVQLAEPAGTTIAGPTVRRLWATLAAALALAGTAASGLALTKRSSRFASPRWTMR